MPDHGHGSNEAAAVGAVAMTEQLSVERSRREDCISACSAVHDRCLAAVEYCLRRGGEYADARHIRTLLDAAQGSEVSRDFMLRGSKLSKLYCRGCAHAADECAKTCERFADDEFMRAYAETCRRCADACRQIGAAQRHETQTMSHG
jgi:hypothetical protein